MKRFPLYASSWTRGISLLAACVFVLAFAACGGRDTVASRSAAAYAEAVEKGLTIEEGHGHGAGDDGHATPATVPTSDAEHETAEHEVAAHEIADHEMPEHTTADHQVAGHEVAGHEVAGHDVAHTGGARAAAGQHAAGHAAPRAASADHAQHLVAGTTAPHGSMQHTAPEPAAGEPEHAAHGMTGVAIPPGGLWGPVPGSSPVSPALAPSLPVVAAPSTSAAIAAVDPAATLAPDRADAPAAISVIESRKGTGEAHEGHEPPREERHEHPPGESRR